MRGTCLLVLATLLSARPASAAAHDKGVIRLGAAEVAAGAELEVRGEKLPPSTEFTLVLRGALETHTLARVRTDTAGAFVAEVALPAAAAPGAYVVRALAPDGDESARADLRLLPAAASAAAEADHGGGSAGHAPRTTVAATAEPLDLPQNRGPLEWAAILGLSAGSLLGGLVLLRRA